MSELKKESRQSRHSKREEAIKSAKRRHKTLKILFWTSEIILLIVVIVCAISLKLLSGFRVLDIPDEGFATNPVENNQTQISTNDNGETVVVDVTTSPTKPISTESSVAAPFSGEEYTTIVIYGLDGRGDVTSIVDSSNSDVIILASINNNTGAVKLCSVYRDTMVKMYPDENKDIPAAFTKANYPLCKYDVVESINTLNTNLDISIDHFVTINWASAVEIINALGGVDIELKKAYYDIMLRDETTGEVVYTIDENTGEKVAARVPYFNGLISELVDCVDVPSTAIPKEEFKDGNIWHCDGVQAVAYMRLRKTDSDIFRTARQREIIEKIIEKAKSADVSTLLEVLDIVKANMSWSINQSDLLGLLYNINNYHIEGTSGYPFELYGGEDYTDKKLKWMIIPVNVVKNVQKLHEYLYGQTDYEPTESLKKLDDELRRTALYDEDWKLTIETKSYD